MFGNRFRKIVLVFFLILTFASIICTCSSYLVAANSTSLKIYDRKVLVIQSYNRDYIHTRALEEGILKIFKNSSANISINYEFLDTKKFFTPEYFHSLFIVFAEKYKQEHFDAIILCDDDALNFYQIYGQKIWGPTKHVVATGINSINIYPDGIPGLILIEERPNYEKTIDLALKQNMGKNISTLNFIYDNTTTSREVKRDIVKLIGANYPALKHNHYFQETPETLRDIVNSADEHNIFFFILYSTSPDGRNFLYDEVPRFILKNSKNPVYSLWEFYLGSGVIGGYLASSSKYGESAAQTVLDLWAGKNLPTIIYDNGENQHYIFDYNIMQKYNINYTPNNALFINKPETYFQKNKEIILFFSSIISVLLLLIILLLIIINQKQNINKKNQEISHLSTEIIETQKDLISRLGDVIETRSHETANHVRRVAKISAVLGKAYGLSNEELQALTIVSPMHDVGKIAISEAILQKPAKLSPKEFEIMKTHTQIGYDIFKNAERQMLKYASLVALEHHERWDGTGYPNGKKSDEISIFARITAIADVYDALCSNRPYKKAWLPEDALIYLVNERGKIFDPHLVDLFLENNLEINKIREEWSDKPHN